MRSIGGDSPITNRKLNQNRQRILTGLEVSSLAMSAYRRLLTPSFDEASTQFCLLFGYSLPVNSCFTLELIISIDLSFNSSLTNLLSILLKIPSQVINGQVCISNNLSHIMSHGSCNTLWFGFRNELFSICGTFGSLVSFERPLDGQHNQKPERVVVPLTYRQLSLTGL